MAQSENLLAKRLRKFEDDMTELKGVAVQTTGILVELSNRTDAGFKAVSTRLDAVTDRLDAVTERLDRLISATLRERTASAERLADIERRLARLEAHAGL